MNILKGYKINITEFQFVILYWFAGKKRCKIVNQTVIIKKTLFIIYAYMSR